MSRLLSWLSLSIAVCVACPGLPWAAPADEPTPAAPQFAPPSASTARRVGQLLDRVRAAENSLERQQLEDEIVDVGPQAIPLLLTELERRSPATRESMVYALGAIGDPRVIPILRRELSNQSGLAYQEVLYALALAGDDTALLQAMRSAGSASMLQAGATALDYIAGSVGPRAVPLLMQEIPRRAEEARAAGLGALGTICDASAVDFLLEWSRQKAPIDRRFAIVALARIGDPRAAGRVREALADPDASVRNAAAEGIGYMRDAQAVPQLVGMMQGPAQSETRYFAVWSLGLIGGDTAARALARALETARPDETALLVQALGNTRSELVIEPLAKLALAPDRNNSLLASQALARIPGDAARAKLLEIACNTQVHEAGLDAARELVERRDPRAVPCVLQRVREEIERNQGIGPEADALLTRLQALAPPSTAESLDAMAEATPAPAIQHRLLGAAHAVRMVNELGNDVGPWLELLENGSPLEIDLAVERLGELGDARAVEPLRRLFGRIEPERAYRIPQALGRIGSERATPFLIALITDDLYRVPSLAEARKQAACALARAPASGHVPDALREAFVAEGGTTVVPLLAYARTRGAAAIPDLVALKSQLLRRRNPAAVERHERVNWALRMLRAGREIPLEELKD
ncbi:MAG: HEAT repeat domain-containing protein [Acidobacteria bacterium]|nr:HEAT repeat domain-containing protein [Acidobacteriota bacterium]